MALQRHPRHFILPNTLKDWPWSRQINPNYEVVKKEATEWLHSFKAFSPKAQAAFDACDFALYASLAYYWYDKERLRTCVDALILSFVFDEYSDSANASQVREYGQMMLDAMRNTEKPRPKGESVIGEMARQYWSHGVKYSTATTARRLIQSAESYTDGVFERARDRDIQYKRTIEEYFAVRRKTIGGIPAFILMQLDLDIPDKIQEHPLIVNLSEMIINLFILCNDMCSYNKEQARGDDIHNTISIVMHNMNISLQDALLWVEQYHSDIVSSVLHWVKNCPWTRESNPEIMRYIEGIINWIRANDCWHFESGRYFGENGLKVQKTRLVTLIE